MSSCESVGDNKEFTVAAVSDVTIYFNGGAAGTSTSANDTATSKYFDTQSAAKQIQIRSNYTIQILSINGVTQTDPIAVILNKGWKEIFDSAIVFKIVIRTTFAGTAIKIRYRGR